MDRKRFEKVARYTHENLTKLVEDHELYKECKNTIKNIFKYIFIASIVLNNSSRRRNVLNINPVVIVL